MKVISWNVENALRCLPALPTTSSTSRKSRSPVPSGASHQTGKDGQAIGALTQGLPGYRCHYSLPRDPRNVTFRGGRMYGVATFVQGRWRAEVPEWDLGGASSSSAAETLPSSTSMRSTALPSPISTVAGLSITGDRHALKRRFQSRVMDLGRELRKEGAVIMIGDWNVSRAAQDTYPRLRTEEPHALRPGRAQR